jgi:hypothetical protein
MYYSRLVESEISKNIKNSQAVILTGMRRVGKTTLMKKIYNSLSDNKIWFDFENPLDIKYFEDIDYNDIFENIVRKGNLNRKNKIYVFIDEVQLYPEISKIVKYLIDHKKVKFFLTGSSSYYLKNLFPESLAGRKVVFEMFPLNFEEFLTFKEENLERYVKIKKQKNINQLDYELYDSYYQEYLEWGGFPEVVLEKDQKNKESLLKDIFSSYYQHEILQLADFRKNEKIRDLLVLLSARVGSQLDIVKISQELQITRKTVYSYLYFLQATYLIFLINPFSKSVDREVSGTQKIYFCDNGLLKIINSLNQGQLLENSIFNQLKFYGTVNFYRKRTGAEIDFIVNKKEAFEVKNTATEKDVKKMKRIMKILKIKQGQVVSKNFIKEQEGVVYGEFL